MEPLRDERLHEETPHRSKDASDQTGCRLTDESTTPPYQRRPGTASGTSAVLWPPTAALPSVRQESSHGLGPRAVPGITHVGLDDSRLLRTGSFIASGKSARATESRRLKPPLQQRSNRARLVVIG